MNQRETLKINDKGHLEIGGADAEELVKQFGTPLYVMDKAYIGQMCTTLTSALKNEYGSGLISYASKAFCCKEIYRIIEDYDMGADVVSGGELYTAKKSGFPMDKITFHGNNKSFTELTEAVSCGVKHIVIDSLGEAEDLEEICAANGTVQNVLIRVNPGVEAHTHHFIQTAKQDSKFGFSLTDGSAEDIINSVIKKPHLKLCGLHCHIGSQIFEIKSFCIAVEKMTDFYKKISDELGISFSVLNLGGGFGIHYAEGDPILKLSDYYDFVKTICDKLKTCLKEKGLEKPYLILEPGRSVVGEAGVTLYTAGRIKEIKGIKNYVAIDGGMFDNPRFALYQARYTVAAAAKMLLKPVKKYTIAGKCCESGDIIAEDCMLPEIEERDIIAVFSTGAYNYSMASNYNRNPVPPVVFAENGKAYYAVKPQTYKDIARNDV